MPSQPLTPAGVAAKLTELYALTDPQLALQADGVEINFSSWIASNFTLTTTQSDYLSRMNVHSLKYYGLQCSMAFRSRLPIILISPTPIPGYTKWTGCDSTLTVMTNASGDLETTGSLTFKMEYRP